MMDMGTSSISVIPVLVTGIQRAQVLGRRRLIAFKRLIHGADAPWLDSCDKHRNDGGDWSAASILNNGWLNYGWRA